MPASFVPRKRDAVAHPPPAASVRRYRAVLSIVTLLCPPDLRPISRSRVIETSFVVGLVNVAPIARPTALMRGLGRNAPFFNSPDATMAESLHAETSDATSDSTLISTESSPQDTAIDKTTRSALQTTRTTDEQPPSPKNGRQFQRKGVWMPPSQNPGKIFSIQQPQDLLDFVIEDERLSVVKVYASWCKTCQVFDMRYRRLASQIGDEHSPEGRAGQISKKGRARFAEMQYDNPNNKEMCQLLNATKLPYILMYKGSKGKVNEFQCNPSEFQILIDAVNELADPAVVMGDDYSKETDIFDKLEVTDTLNATTTSEAATAQEPSWTEVETIDELKQQLVKESAEKFEMFEVLKAQIEYDKGYIVKLETGIETQRSMLEVKDGELSTLQSVLNLKEKKIESLTAQLSQQQEENQCAKRDLSAYESQVSQLTNRVSEVESTIASLELESSVNKKTAQVKEWQLLQQMEEWEKLKSSYEKERSSLRQLALLGIKRVGRGARYLLLRLRRKRID